MGGCACADSMKAGMSKDLGMDDAQYQCMYRTTCGESVMLMRSRAVDNLLYPIYHI